MSSSGTPSAEARAQTRFAAPRISLPTGGGAIRGIGEKFAANPATGTGSTTVPIAVPPGRSGFGPQLSLAYDSGSGNGPFGFGWSLSLPSITRKTDRGLPRYNDAGESDVFLISGAEDLVPVLAETGAGWTRVEEPRTVGGTAYRVFAYRPRTEGLFSRIERWTAVQTGETHWRSISRDNITTLYGRDNGSRIFDPADPDPLHPTRVFQWLACESWDDRGNAMVYRYLPEDRRGVDTTQAHERHRTVQGRSANRYLKRILYGNRVSRLAQPELTDPRWMFEVVLDYGDHDADAPTPGDTGAWLCRRDPFSSYRAGFEVRTYRLCQRVLVFHHFPGEPEVGADCLVRSLNLAYRDDPRRGAPVASFIASATQHGYRRQGAGYLQRALPPLEFGYTEAVIDDRVVEVAGESLENLPQGVDGAAAQWVDLDGEGVTGVLVEERGAWHYKRGRGGGRFGTLETVAALPTLAVPGGGAQLLDLAGDGRLELVDFSGATPGFWERTDDAGWEPFRPFVQLPALAWNDPGLRFADLDGDGHADVLRAEGDALAWYPSLGEEGFAPARRVATAPDDEEGPRLVFGDGTNTVFLADMSGDGLTDLVRIRNGEVCYWPSLGYGRFGARVAMDHAPWFEEPGLFDPRRLRVADIDGSGNTDLIYLGRDGVRIWFNHSGNGWSAPRALGAFPPFDSLASVTAVDLLGNGTACLAWSSPLPGEAGRALRYVDLMGGQKPHLLVSVKNNLGAETVVRYAPSTRFYLADRAAGRPWATRLPFPVQVVERVETYDRVSRNRFVTRYAYHHGHFDGVEREFRGFGMVEQWDTEELSALAESDAFPAGDNVDATTHVPPALTRTWYHTGVFVDEAGRVSRRFEGEYYREGDPSLGEAGLTDAELEAMLLADTELPSTLLQAGGTRRPWTLSADEAREACRALRGSVLRQEVYAADGGEEADRPYRVSERSYAVELLQPRAGGNAHAVCFARPRETVEFHYERRLYGPAGARRADPRVSHEVVLEVDEYSHVLGSVAVAYGRRRPDPELTAPDKAQQARTLVTLTETRYTTPLRGPDHHRGPLEAETRGFELLNVTPAGTLAEVTNLFRFGELEEKVRRTALRELPYEDVAGAGAPSNIPCRRPIEHVRTLYRHDTLDDAAGPLPLGTAQPLGLPYESYRLAFTPGLLAGVFRRTRGGATEDLVPDPVALLGGECGYLRSDELRGARGFPAGDPAGRWWIPSGRTFLSPNDADRPDQERAHAAAHFFLSRRFRDPFGNVTRVAYDGYDLLVQETRDPLGNTVTVGERGADGALLENGNDYRVQQPRLVTDANGNRTAAAFDARGLVTGTAVMGKRGEALGDSLAGFEPDPDDAAVTAHLAAPAAAPHTLLGAATTRVLYDLDAYHRTRGGASPEPAVACTLARETHGADLPAGTPPRVQQSFTYADGFGREVQRKAPAEPGPLAEGGPVVSPRWVGSGWTVYNNKGNPVRRYEPFFTATHRFELARTAGVGAVLFYDPLQRVVATLHPNATYEKVVFDPWRQVGWDANDTVLLDPRTDPDVRKLAAAHLAVLAARPGGWAPWHAARAGGARGPREKAAATQAAAHAGTPLVTVLDPLGRPFLRVAHNRVERGGTAVDERYATRVVLDVEGNERRVDDALGRAALHYDYDLLGNELHLAGVDAGERWTLLDAAGKPVRAWDGRGSTRRTVYDALRRAVEVFVREGGGPERLVERTAYGEGRPTPEAANLRTRVFSVHDGSGAGTREVYDFKGNLLQATRQLRAAYEGPADWGAAPPPPLEHEVFTTRMRYDALNRVVQQVAPHRGGVGPGVSVVQPAYNEAGLPERVDAWLDRTSPPTALLDPATATLHAVTGMEYDARGERTRVEYGNGTTSTFRYDPETFRLSLLFTTRGAAFPEHCAAPPDPPCGLQNLRYTYDPVGNVTHVADGAQQTVFFSNRRVDPDAAYTYDALYRLLTATGREHLGQVLPAGPLPPERTGPGDGVRGGVPHPGDGDAMGRYLERFDHDALGNLREVRHRGSDPSHPGWKRCYQYLQGTNRLLGTGPPESPADPDSHCAPHFATTPDHVERYAHDENGNVTAMPHLRLMRWDHRDRLQATADQDATGGAIPETTYYACDAGGERVRKATERAVTAAQAAAGVRPTRRRERLYLGGLELYREYAADGTTVTLERETLHLMDGPRRIAVVETRTAGADPAPTRLVRFQHGNHLASASLELDERARIVSYEEYYPYGGTACQTVRSRTETPRRYRFTGKERDEESGLYYHGSRYYAPWLGRWTAVDPLLLERGNGDDARAAERRARCLAATPYGYAWCNPLRFVDPDGRENLVVVGAQYDNSVANKLSFAHQGIRQIREYERTQPQEQRTMVLFREGYSAAQITAIRETVERHGGRFVLVDSIQELAHYVNTGVAGSGPPAGPREAITNMDLFSHGVVGAVEFGYHTGREAAYRLNEGALGLFNRSAFASNAVVVSYACRTGLGNPAETVSVLSFLTTGESRTFAGNVERYYQSLAQRMSNQWGVTVQGYARRSNYADTLGSRGDRCATFTFSGCQVSPDLRVSLGRRRTIDGALFDPEGAVRPVSSGDTPTGLPSGLRTYTPISADEERRRREADDQRQRMIDFATSAGY